MKIFHFWRAKTASMLFPMLFKCTRKLFIIQLATIFLQVICLNFQLFGSYGPKMLKNGRKKMNIFRHSHFFELVNEIFLTWCVWIICTPFHRLQFSRRENIEIRNGFWDMALEKMVAIHKKSNLSSKPKVLDI